MSVVRGSTACWVVLALALTATQGLAQSGRRVPPRRTTPPPAASTQPPATVEPDAPAPAPVPDGEKIPVTTAKYRISFSIRDDTCDAVIAACARELGESSIARPLPGGDLSRKAAIDLAKAGSGTFVLYFQFSFDGLDDDPAATSTRDDALLVANYILYEPVTAKIRTQGRVYFRSYDSNSRRSPSLGGVTRGAQGLSPTETGLKIAAAVLEALERDLLPRP